MSEQNPEDNPPAGRMSTAIAMARVEAKLDVAIAQQSMWREETTRRLGEHDAVLARINETLSQIQQEQAASKAAAAQVAADRPPKVSWPGWVGLVLALLTGLYLILDHTPGV